MLQSKLPTERNDQKSVIPNSVTTSSLFASIALQYFSCNLFFKPFSSIVHSLHFLAAVLA